MKLNLKIRAVNWAFWLNVVLAALAPILAYFGLSGPDITSWPLLLGCLLSALKNPYVLFLAAVGVWNALFDPTTPGLSDSIRALGYVKPGGF